MTDSIGPFSPLLTEKEVLEVHGLTKIYRKRSSRGQELLANDHLDLNVRRGEIIALLGPNGAGKSTFLRQVAGQLLPTSGTIAVQGIDMIAHPQEAKRLVSVIPQECQPIENLTVEEHVRYFARIKSDDRRASDARVPEVLGAVGLRDRGQHLVRDLSGGYKRRVLIAVALAGDSPPLLLLDEPTTGLDPEARRSVWRVIESLRADGRGILLTTHYIEEAEFLADRVVIINDGKIVARGTVDEIRSKVRSRGRMDVRITDRLSSSAKAAIAALEDRWPVTMRQENHLRFDIPDPFSPETIAELSRLADLGVEASLAPPSLEDAYLQLVGPEAGIGGNGS
jgi:ABC-2 type transport system ATP-binding protein